MPQSQRLSERQLTQLQTSAVKHLSFVRVPRNESIDFDVLRLPDSMATSLGLKVVLRIPVRVVNDHGVGCDKIDAKATGSSAEQKYESEQFDNGKTRV